jgi:hypothetical protein
MIARVICTASIVTLGAMGIDAQMAPARADSPPVLKVESSCEAAGRGAVVLGRNKEACLADETTAQDTPSKTGPSTPPPTRPNASA